MQQPYDQNRVTTGDWLLTFLLTNIPLVGLIMLFVWAFGENTKASKKTYARAMLIWTIIMTVVGVILSIVLGIALSVAGLSFFAVVDSMMDSFY